jgi:hypothetical protein
MVNMLHGLGDAGDFLHAAGERERALKCGCLPRNAGDLTGLKKLVLTTLEERRERGYLIEAYKLLSGN